MSSDRYRTLAGESQGVHREKASKFIAYAFPIEDENSFSRRCSAIAKEHHASRHVCYAWVLGGAGDRFRAHDAGEPSGTAGKPILRQLQGADLTMAAIVVVRYFGGTLLGKGGLVHAYAEVAREALATNTIIEHVMRSIVRVHCAYTLVEAIKADVAKSEGDVLDAAYLEQCALLVSIPRSVLPSFIERWTLAGAILGADQPK